MLLELEYSVWFHQERCLTMSLSKALCRRAFHRFLLGEMVRAVPQQNPQVPCWSRNGSLCQPAFIYCSLYSLSWKRSYGFQRDLCMIQSTRIVLLLISSSYSISEFLLQVFPYTQLTINCDFCRPLSQVKDEAQRRSILDLVCKEEIFAWLFLRCGVYSAFRTSLFDSWF